MPPGISNGILLPPLCILYAAYYVAISTTLSIVYSRYLESIDLIGCSVLIYPEKIQTIFSSTRWGQFHISLFRLSEQKTKFLYSVQKILARFLEITIKGVNPNENDCTSLLNEVKQMLTEWTMVCPKEVCMMIIHLLVSLSVFLATCLSLS